MSPFIERRCLPMSHRTSNLLLLLAVCVAAGTGCSSFGREWNQARTLPQDPVDISGRWEGRWISQVNGHQGELRAVVTPLGEDRFRFRYRASYGGFLRFGYTMELAAPVDDQGRRTLQGEASLGLWGQYRCEGYATSNTIRSVFETRLDRGVFRLGRPVPGKP